MEETILQGIVRAKPDGLICPLARPCAVLLQSCFEALVMFGLCECAVGDELRLHAQGCNDIAKLRVCRLEGCHCCAIIGGFGPLDGGEGVVGCCGSWSGHWFSVQQTIQGFGGCHSRAPVTGSLDHICTSVTEVDVER